MKEENIKSLVPKNKRLPKSKSGEAIARAKALDYQGFVGHLSHDEILRLLEAVKEISRPKFRERNSLLLKTLYDGCLRVSEALTLRPQDIVETQGGFRVRLTGKGKNPAEAAISPRIANELRAYAYETSLPRDRLFFPITRRRVHQLIEKAMKRADIRKPDRTGAVHLLRHTGALERLKKTGNPRAVQHQLRHKSVKMTLRYMKTLEAEGALRLQESIDLWER